MKHLLIIILLFPVICKADYGIGEYLLTGTMYLPNNTPLRNKTIVIAGSENGPLSVKTDGSGHYKAIVRYIIPCMSGQAPKGPDYIKRYNRDSLTISYRHMAARCANHYLDFFTARIHRYNIGKYNEDNMPEWLTIHCDINLSDKWMLTKDERWQVAAFIRQMCKIGPDSFLNNERYSHLRPTREANSIPAFIDSYQPLTKTITEFKSMSIWCPSLFSWQYNQPKNEYGLSTMLAPGFTKTIRTDNNGKIIETQNVWVVD